MAMNPADPAQVGAVLKYIVAEVIALEQIVADLAIAIDTASGANTSLTIGHPEVPMSLTWRGSGTTDMGS